MNNKTSKTRNTIIGCLQASLLIIFLSTSLASCIKDEEIVTSPQCAITSFAVGSIKSYVTVTKYDDDGNAVDTLVARTVDGSDIYFNIDQLNGLITTVDSLPNWIDLTRVVPSFTSYGTVYGKIGEDDTFYYIESENDSVDFSKPTELVCVATDGVSIKHYLLEMKVASNNIDTLEWKHSATKMPVKSLQNVVKTSGGAMAFGLDENGAMACATSTDGVTWTAAQKAEGVSVDAKSVVMFGGKYYALAEGGTIASSVDGVCWNVASEQVADQLLAADDYYLYIVKDGTILGSEDLQTWSVQGTSEVDMLPQHCVNCASYRSRTNANIVVSVLTGLCDNDAEYGTVWYKMSSQSSNMNQQWAYISPATDNPYVLPRLGNMSMTLYEDVLYAIGTEDGKYVSIYHSRDNGITWLPMASQYPMPADIDPNGGMAWIVGVGSKLWIVQEDGNVWVGAIL